MIEFFGENTVPLLIRLGFNLISVFILIRFVYFPINKKREYLFILVMFNILIFFVASLLNMVKMKTGFAFGLFAIFSIIRYRTQQIPIKEMTFMFSSIILATINSMVTRKLEWGPILIANVSILIASFLLERYWNNSHKESKTIMYENIDLIKPEHRESLINDLKVRTGLNILDIKIGDIDFLKDQTSITVFYRE